MDNSILTTISSGPCLFVMIRWMDGLTAFDFPHADFVKYRIHGSKMKAFQLSVHWGSRSLLYYTFDFAFRLLLMSWCKALSCPEMYRISITMF